MSEQAATFLPPDRPFNSDVDGFWSLTELAMDLRWSWNHSGRVVAAARSRALGRSPITPAWCFRPWRGRRSARPWPIRTSARMLDRLVQARRQAAAKPGWFQQKHPNARSRCVAYFCMEFMLSEALPIYSGGLGNVAGDQLKAASDLGVPVIGVGLLYQHGYFRQVIDRDGAQQALYPYNDPGQLPITPVAAAEWRVAAAGDRLPGYSVWLRAWQVQVGRVKLYLLDTNDAANLPAAPGDHQRTVRRRAGAAPEAGDGSGDRRMAAARRTGHQAGGLPPQRRARRLRRAGARPQLHAGDRAALRGRAGGHARRQPVHHPHGGRRRLRPLRPGPGGAVPGRLRPGEARHFARTSCWRWAARTRTTRRSLSTWPTWRSAAAGRSTA